MKNENIHMQVRATINMLFLSKICLILIQKPITAFARIQRYICTSNKMLF